MNVFAAGLTELREANNMQQNELSAILHVTPGTISNYESGRHNPDFTMLVTIADYFHVSLDYLLGRSDAKSMVGMQKYTSDCTVAQVTDLLNNVPQKHRQSLVVILEALSDQGKVM